MKDETPEDILALANEIIDEGHPENSRIYRLAWHLKELLEGMGIGPADPKCAGYPPCRDARGCPCQQDE